jgi:hypothetical protein
MVVETTETWFTKQQSPGKRGAKLEEVVHRGRKTGTSSLLTLLSNWFVAVSPSSTALIKLYH